MTGALSKMTDNSRILAKALAVARVIDLLARHCLLKLLLGLCSAARGACAVAQISSLQGNAAETSLRWMCYDLVATG